MFSKSTKILRIIIPLTLLLSATVVFAAPSWWPIVPCGLTKPAEAPEGSYLSDSYYQPCNPCDLFKMGRNIIDFVLLGLMPPVAAGLFIWGGFLILMGGPNPALFAKGKQIFTTTFYGVLIILGSWLITNTIMMSVAQDSVMVGDTVVNIVTDWNKFTCEYTGTAPTNQTGALTISPASLPDAVPGQNYSQTLSVSGGVAPYDWSATDAGGLPGGFSFDSDTVRIYGSTQETGSFTFTAQVKDSTTPTALTGTKTFTLKVGTTTVCDGATLAANNNEPYRRKNSQELDTLISCIKSKLPGIDLGSQFTYDESYESCNYTRGQRTSCTPQCSHAVNSCHYGGRTGSEGAQAVDFGNENNGNAIIQAAQECEVPTGKARCENAAGANVGCASSSGANHVHISTAGCDAN